LLSRVFFAVVVVVVVVDGKWKSMAGTKGLLDGTTWMAIAWLMLSDIVGTSVLTLNGVAVQLGWVLTSAFILGLFPVSLYTALIMCRTRSMLTQEAEADQSLGSMGDVAAFLFQSQRAGTAIFVAVYGYTLLGQASYLLVLGTSLQKAFFSVPLCLPTAVAIACLALLLPTFLVRKLADSVILCFVNSLIILGVVVIALVQAGQRQPVCQHTFLLAPGLSFMTALGAATNIIYSFSGQWMYFELMDTMSDPEDFVKSFVIAGPFMLTTYLTVALLGYGFGAGSGDLVASMEYGVWLQVAAALLFVHVLIVYLIKSVVLARFFHGLCRPVDVEARSLKSYLGHGSCGVGILAFGFGVSNAVPFFSQLLGIIGGLMAGPVSFLLPISFYLTALGQQLEKGRHQQLGTGGQQAELVCGGPSESNEDESQDTFESVDGDDGAGGDGGCSLGAEERHGLCHLALSALSSLPLWEKGVITVSIVFVLLTMAFGVAEEIRQVIALWDQLGGPFTCHALPAPSRPACE